MTRQKKKNQKNKGNNPMAGNALQSSVTIKQYSSCGSGLRHQNFDYCALERAFQKIDDADRLRATLPCGHSESSLVISDPSGRMRAVISREMLSAVRSHHAAFSAPPSNRPTSSLNTNARTTNVERNGYTPKAHAAPVSKKQEEDEKWEAKRAVRMAKLQERAANSSHKNDEKRRKLRTSGIQITEHHFFF